MQKLRTRLLAKKDAMKKNKKGFTLVEIIVVLAIIAILAAVTIPSIIGFVNQAKEKVMISDARAAYIACQMEVSETFAANHAKGTADKIDYTAIKKADIEAYVGNGAFTEAGFTVDANGSITEFMYKGKDATKYVAIHANKGAEVVSDKPTVAVTLS